MDHTDQKEQYFSESSTEDNTPETNGYAEEILAVLTEHGRLEKKDLFRLLNCESPQEKDEVTMALGLLRRKDKIGFLKRYYFINAIDTQAVLDVIRRHGSVSLGDICSLLEEEYGKGQDLKKIKEKLTRLKKTGLVLFDGKKWVLGHDPEPDDVLALVQKKESGITLVALSKKLGCLSDKRKKELQSILLHLEQANKIRFHHNRYCPVPGLSAKALLRYMDELGGAFIEDLYAYFDIGFEERSQMDKMLEELVADKAVLFDRGLYTRLRPEKIEGIYTPSDGQAQVRAETPDGLSVTLNIRHSPVLLLPGDKILVQPLEAFYPGYIPKCDVVEVVRETTARITLELLSGRKNPDILWGRAVSRRFVTNLGDTSDIFVVDSNDIGAENTDIAEAKPLFRKDGFVHVQIVKITRAMSSVREQEDLVKLNHMVPQAFPDQVLKETKKLPLELTAADRENRTDLTGFPFVTLDGADARDFDDAVCVERLPRGYYRLRVAIADVSHYVRPGSPLDREALLRGNSWYFPTSVEPMLPEELCNNLCSLMPDKDRLVVFASLEFTPKGKRRKSSFGLGVIHSAARLTYDQAKSLVIDRDEEECASFSKDNPRSGEIISMLEQALELFHVLADVRDRRGALNFDLPEPEACFDSRGRITDLRRTNRHDMHRLIEEFMIAANEAVAEFLEAGGYPCIFRVHPAISQDKLNLLHTMLVSCGFLPRKKEFTAKMLPDLLRSLKGQPGESVFNRLCVRSMAQAKYSPENIGHFGLASQAYCHFTSPIRRYTDLVVHRAIKLALGCDDGPVPAGKGLVRICDMLNRQERAAMECEREMNRRMACMWMQKQPRDREWSCTVASVQPYGTFVELDSCPVEGLVHIEALKDSWRLDFRPGTEELASPMAKRCYRIGTHMTVRLVSVDPVMLYINFAETRSGDSSRTFLPQRKGKAAKFRRKS